MKTKAKKRTASKQFNPSDSERTLIVQALLTHAQQYLNNVTGSNTTTDDYRIQMATQCLQLGMALNVSREWNSCLASHLPKKETA